MENNLPEIVFSTSDGAQSQRTSRLVKAGRLRKISPRVYTSNLVEAPAQIVKRNLYPILKTLPISGIEERLDRICQAQGAEALNALRDAARKLAVPLRMEDSFRHLNAMISAMLR